MEEEARLWAYGGEVVEVAPGGAGAEVDNNDPVPAFGGGIGDVGNTGAGRGKGRADVEAHVVEVGVGEGDGWGKEDGGEDGVVREVDADEFRAAKAGTWESAIEQRCPAGVQNPKTVSRVNDNALRTNEVIGVADARLDISSQFPARCKRCVMDSLLLGRSSS